MTMSRDLFLAILAMDSYNRGYGAGVGGLLDTDGTQIGTATIVNREGGAAARAAGFYAVAYSWQGETVISYRGTDVFADNPATGGSDILNGWVGALGTITSQVDQALAFYQTVTGRSVFTGPDPNFVLTGHSLGGGLAGIVSALSSRSPHKNEPL